MATDYDAPRKSDDDSESIEALKERVPDKMSGSVDVDDSDNPSGFELPGADLSDLELDVVVLPPQQDEFTCASCFLCDAVNSPWTVTRVWIRSIHPSARSSQSSQSAA